MTARTIRVALATIICACFVTARPEAKACNVVAHTEAGWVCGLTRWAEAGTMYASFRGVPYARQPVGELRFKELQPLEPWDFYYDATEEGPICHQTDVLYGKIMRPRGMNEACIYANIHVPLEALPNATQPDLELKPPYGTGVDENKTTGLPIVVFIHGGGFAFGSGDSDLHGPEYLVARKVIVITFNYRLNVFGFLSLNSSSVPGNAGLRDMVTLLRWVQRNAQAFGGNSDDVTLMGQSAGAAAAHMLSLSKDAEGLFKRAILMSGTAISSFFTTSPIFSQFINKLLLSVLGINSTDPGDIHRQLIEIPVEKINEANSFLLDQIGITTFFPVVETSFTGVTTILDDDPEVLIAKGRGKDIPLLIGFTSSECETFRRRFEKIDIVSRIKDNPNIIAPVNLIYSISPEAVADVSKKIDKRYFNGTINLDRFIKMCTDSYYLYPAMKLAEMRAKLEGAPVYMYQFSYDGVSSPFKEVSELKFKGAGHIEDLTYLFRVNSMLGTRSSFPPENGDDQMKYWMTTFVTNFMKCGNPLCNDRKSTWLPVKSDKLKYQDIEEPNNYLFTEPTKGQQEMKEFFDSIHKSNNNVNGVK